MSNEGKPAPDHSSLITHCSSPTTFYPCRCLCFGFSQMMRITPCRRTTLHFVQIFLTDERTFMITPGCWLLAIGSWVEFPTAKTQELFVPIRNAPSRQVIRRQFHEDLVA